MKEKNNPIAEILFRMQGMDVSKYEDVFLNNTLHLRIIKTHCNSEKSYCNFLEQDVMERKLFLDALLISYSEFFRNSLTFSVLEHLILPSIALKKGKTKQKEIRIWSAACAGGQEAYSLAMLLEELIKGDNVKLKYRIFATDQSESQLSKARSGKYEASELNKVSMKLSKQWFTQNGELFTIKPELKENIDFSVFDLFNKQFSSPSVSIFGDFDLVVCANLLFYYKPEYRKIILEKTGNAMAGNGFLICGETEREILMNHNYQEIYPQSAIFNKNVFKPAP